jgi:hypothetical protein
MPSFTASVKGRDCAQLSSAGCECLCRPVYLDKAASLIPVTGTCCDAFV